MAKERRSFLNRHRLVISDDGKGFRDRREIELFFQEAEEEMRHC